MPKQILSTAKGKMFIVLMICISIGFLAFNEENPSQDALVRKVSEVKRTAERAIALNGNLSMLRKGYLDVTSAPYFADSTGKKDATKAIQQALKDARDARLICYLPAGNYLVSNTITGIQGTIEWDEYHFEGFVDPWLGYASFEYPNVMMGSPTGGRTRLILADNADGFNDPDHPKPVIHFWSRMEYGQIDKTKAQPNINFNQKILDIDFDLGKGNLGAVAIRHQGAEGSTIENVTIHANDAFAGIQSAPGSGGGIYNVSITGGKYGFYIRNKTKGRGSQPSPVLAGIRLKNQTEKSILYDGRGPLTLVGAFIEGSGIQSDCPKAINWNGSMNIVDAVIKMKNNEEAILSNHSVVLDNVFIWNSDTVVNINGGAGFQGKGDGWTHVKLGVLAGKAKNGRWTDGAMRRDDIWVNNTKEGDHLITIDSQVPNDPEKLVKKHALPADFPSCFSDGAVNVMDAPYFAKGDGVSDDSEAIQKAIEENEIVFLPKGHFAISKPLKLKSNTKLVGVGNVQTVITAIAGAAAFTDPDNPLPLVETVDDPDATCILAFMELSIPVKNTSAYALCWRAGRNSIVRDVYSIREPSHPDAAVMGHQMIKIEKSGGGRWYTNVLLHWWDQGPNYRHLLVEGTNEPLRFYMLEPQHGRSEYMVEMKNSENIDVFAVKSEGDYGVACFDHCKGFRVFGFGGNGMPHPGYSIFTVKDSENFLLANINPQHKAKGHYGALGTSHNPYNWNILKSEGNEGVVQIPGTEQFTFFTDKFSIENTELE